ncbi:hypothetical protein PHSY_003341 [Pseudozyma hubeiensis SY62]|uniref:Uncharacterized protein n=1 Tax=Pseudozyma hubeiensis (strain SY62) TaxID=1305764 RepID=R9PCH0_PSEHS|nr:hypothetical protein PHSY_003341 [Pseudozyma hubeiensis SY62]GAC95765.1 hypothetical protein PHSY_003341 [Pseudozyma hubeiensis SY62]
MVVTGDGEGEDLRVERKPAGRISNDGCCESRCVVEGAAPSNYGRRTMEDEKVTMRDSDRWRSPQIKPPVKRQADFVILPFADSTVVRMKSEQANEILSQVSIIVIEKANRK